MSSQSSENVSSKGTIALTIYGQRRNQPKKMYHFVNNCVVPTTNIKEKSQRFDLNNSHDDVKDAEEQSESDSNSEVEGLSKPESISQECLIFIKQVYKSLSTLMYFKEELDKNFTGEGETVKIIQKIFTEISLVKSCYDFIMTAIEKLQKRNTGFYLYELLLKSLDPNILNMYKPFLSQYSFYAKWMGEFNKDNQACKDACNKAKRNKNIEQNVTIDNCLYTVFSSLFSLELIFTRYRNCFSEMSDHYVRADEAKNLISNLLSTMNTSQDQTNFLLSQKELNLLSERTHNWKNGSKFIYKGIVTKFARRDDKSLDRQFVLFSNCLFVTLPPRNIIGTCKVRQELSINSMSVKEIPEYVTSDGSIFKWGLTISAREAVQDFFFNNEQTMKTWKDKILRAISEETTIEDNTISLGNKAPRWQKDSAAGYCNGLNCDKKFSSAIRRHHCRADGLLYCDSCCNFRMKLKFERSAESRVCDLCHNILKVQVTNAKRLEEYKSQLLKVMDRRTHQGKKTGWLLVKIYNKENIFLTEEKCYCVLHINDAFLSLYEKHEDKTPFKRIILLGMDINTMKEGSCYYKTLSSKQFIIQHNDKAEAYLMKALSEDECYGWVECLKERILFCLYS